MSRLLWIPLGAASALVLSVVGCGGVGGADGLFDQGNTGAGGATTTSATTGSETSSATTGSTTTTTTTTTTSSSSSSASSSATGSSSAASSSSSSTGTGTVNDMLDCGAATCALGATTACCWSKFKLPASGACVQGPPDTDGCKTFVADDAMQARIECQVSAQCNGGKCCGHRTFFSGQQNFFYDLVSCQTTCPQSDVRLCDPSDASDVCPMINTGGGQVQGVCKPSTSLPPGYFVCSVP